MKFKFSLEKVLKHRNIVADIAQKNFLEAQSALNAEIDRLNEMIELKNSSIQQRDQIIQTSQNWSAEVEQINQYLTGQDFRIKQQNQRLLEFEKLVESRREILRQAMIEVKIIDKLKEKKKEAYNEKVKKDEQAELDELTVLRFSRIENQIKGSHEDGI